MNAWENHWQTNQERRALAHAPRESTFGGVPQRTPRPTWAPSHTYPAFGADPAVHVVSAAQPMVVPAQSGGTFSNAVLLLLAGFSVGTLWGEGIIGKMIGEKHRTSGHE